MIDILSPNMIRNPYPEYNRIREASPVCEVLAADAPVWLITRYDDVCAGLINHSLFTSTRKKEIYSPSFLSWQDRSDFYMANEDPPVYRKLRENISTPFSLASINDLRPLIEESATRATKNILKQKNIDFIRDYAYPVIGEVTANITGLCAIQTVDEIYDWIQVIELASVPTLSSNEISIVKKKILEKRQLFFEIVKSRKKNKKNDFFSCIMESGLSDTQLVNIIELLIRSSFQSTGHMLANSLVYLLSNQATVDSLNKSPENIRHFVSESLRLFPASPFAVRHATQDIDLKGAIIPKNATVYFSIASANRDPRMFNNADTVDFNRSNNEVAISFGYGPHMCLGIHLAKLELEISLTHLIPVIESMKGPSDHELLWIPTQMFRGLKELPITILDR
jgi:cytochrome P450